MAIQYLGTTISGLASDTKPTLSANEKGVIYIETDTNKIYQWDTDSWNELITTGNTSVGALNSGSITSGFGNIDTGSSTITTTGLITAGNLTVTGTTTTVNATNLLIEDPLLVLAKDQSGSAAWDAGFVIERGNDANMGLIWDESTDTFSFVQVPTSEVGGTAGNVTIDAYADLKAKDIEVTGTLDVTGNATFSGNVSLGDSDNLYIGASNDLQIYHNGSNSYIADTGTGALIVKTNILSIRNAADDAQMIYAGEGNQVDLYHNGSKKFETTSTGVTVTGNVNLADDGQAIFGTGSDFKIYHDGTANIIDGGGTADIKIQDSSHTSAIFDTSAEVQLWYDNSKKFETTSGGATVTGTLTTTADVTVGDDLLLTDGKFVRWGGDSGDTRIYGSAANDLITFVTDGTERVRIDGSGNVGIGTTPSTPFHVVGNTTIAGNTYFGSQGSNYDVVFYGSTSGQNAVWDASDKSLEFADAASANFGTGGDMKIWHDSNTNKIDLTSPLYIYDDSNYVLIGEHASNDTLEMKLVGAADHDAALYFGDANDPVEAGIWWDTSAQILNFNGYNNSAGATLDNTGTFHTNMFGIRSGDYMYLRTDGNGTKANIRLSDSDSEVQFNNASNAGILSLGTHINSTLNKNLSMRTKYVSSQYKVQVGLNIDDPFQNVAGGTVDLDVSGLHIKDTVAHGQILLEANPPSLHVMDSGGSSNDKWMMYRIDGGIGWFQSLNDDGTDRVDNILVMDMGTGNVGLGVEDPDAKLEVAGQIKITGGSPGADKVLTSDGNGLATWESSSGVDLDGAITINDSGASVDFRVESNTNANMLVVDGSADGVAIGASNSNPNGHGAKLLVESSAGSPMVELHSTNTGADGPRIMFTHNTTSLAADDDIAALNFRANHDSSAGGDWIEYFRMAPRVLDVNSSEGKCDVRFTTITYQLAVTAKLAANGQWTNASDASLKIYEGTAHSIYGGTEGRVITDKLKTLNVGRYRYTNTPVGLENDKNTERRIGPTAQDFYNAFGTGTEQDGLGYTYTDKEGNEQKELAQLAPGDVAGVGLMAIKELIKRIEDLEAEVLALKG